MHLLTVSARALGKRKPLVPDWQIPWPPDAPGGGGEPLTLRKFITRVVIAELETFRQRQADGRLARILTERQIEAGIAKGRVDSGGREPSRHVADEDAVATALQAFEDGIYMVILDGEEQRDLDREVRLLPESKLLFVRLVMLAGA